jgi:EAL domain-containing protein (putative c-di-GMP-specific phosphodiesterase class I)
VPASQFLPAVEAAGLMSELGIQVLDLAVQRLSLWAVTNPTRELSVNVSPTELLRPGFVEDVAGIVENGRIDPQRLTLEFAFNPIKADQQELAHVMQRLHRVAGVKLAIDDYAAPGMYSPANVLPVDVLKFDRSITDAITRSSDHRVLLGTLVALVRSAGRQVVATGVESDAQIEAVAGIGIDFAQGYLLGLPEPVDPVGPAASAIDGASPLVLGPERITAGPAPRLVSRAPARRPTWPPAEPAPVVAPAARAPSPTVPPPPAGAPRPTSPGVPVSPASPSVPSPSTPLPGWPVMPAATAPAPEPAPATAVAELAESSPIAGLRLVPDDATGRGVVFERPDGRWSFRVLGPDGEPVAEGADRGYSSRSEARRVVEQLLGGAFDGPVDDLR